MAKRPKTAPTLESLATRRGLEAWLRTQPREVSIAIASRAALRALPRYGLWRADDARLFAELTVALFRATALARVAAKYPTRARGLRAADAAATAARAAPDGGSAAGAAAYAAAHAALAAADAAAAVAAAVAAAFAADAVTANYAAVVAAAAADDAVQIAKNPAALTAVLDSPLWPEDNPEAATNWTRLRLRLPAAEDWSVWIDWYEERLRGGSRGEDYEIVFATVPEEKWKEGAKAANAWIREHLPPEQREPSAQPLPDPDPAALDQKSAPHVFRLDGARIVASPAIGAPDNPRTTQGFLDAARKRVAQLQERAARAQADAYLRDHLDDVAALLAHPLDAIDLGQLVPALEDIESDHTSYNTPSGHAEHPVDLIAGLDSLAKSLRRLVAQYPEARDLAAHQAALALARNPETASAVRAALDRLPDHAAAHKELVSESAVAALRLPEGVERKSRTLGAYLDKLALGALDGFNFGRIVAASGKAAKKAAAQIRPGGAAVAGAATAGFIACWTSPDAIALINHTLHDLTALAKAIGDDAGAWSKSVLQVAGLLTILRGLVGSSASQGKPSPEERPKQNSEEPSRKKTTKPRMARGKASAARANEQPDGSPDAAD